MAAPPDNSGSSLLFDLSPIEEDDAVDVEWRQAFAKLQEAFVDKSEVDIQNWLQINVSKDTASYNETINGLLYTILVATSTTLPANHANNNHDNPGTTAFRRIGLVTRDGLTFIVRQLRYFCHLSSFHKIRTPVREQTIWLVGQLAEARVQGTEVLFTSLLRQIRGGDISPPNIQLADSMLRLLEEQIQFVYSFPHLIAYSCYTFLRLMLDHARVTGLRQREAAFCGRLLRERFRECCEVGRDLIRAMQDVARIKEIEEIWVDLLHAPERLNPQLEGIHQIMATPSNPFYLTGRLTPDMEQKLSHILKHLNHGQHYWNLNKFVERFLSAPETDALFCDVIRYICGVYHPSNQVLASSIVPRFVLINDLFRSVKSNIAAANIKLALFYDWLFYDPTRDNIMNIEPAALLLHDSVVPSRAIHHRQPHMTAILIEFLQFTVDNYHPPMREYLQQHVGMAGQDIVDKGVIKSFGDVYRALSHEHYAPIREHLVALFHPTLGNMGESIPTPVSGGAPGSTGVEAGSADLLDGTDEFETPNSYLDTPPDGIKDDEEEVMMGGSVPRASSETPPPGMDVGDSPKQPSEHDEDMEDEEEDEIMESSAGPTSSLPSTATTSAKVVLDPAASSLLSDWTAGPSSPITVTGVITSGRDDNQPEDKPRSRQSSFAGPSASLWLFGSLPQDFKAAFEEDPKSEKSVDMFRRIWEVFGDEAGAGVDGAELAKEIGREVRAFAAQAVVPETFCSTKHRHHTPLQPLPHRGKGSGVTMDVVLEQQESQDLGPLEGLISCLWKITRREGPSGALRVARLFLQADSQEEYADRQLSMWFLIGILHGYLRSIGSGVVASGDGDVSVAGVLDVYRTLLGEEAAAMAEQQQQPKSETDMELDVAESKSGNNSSINNGPEQQPQEWMQSSLLRDLSLIQDRQLGVFDRVLPLVLEHLSDIVPRTLPFFKLVLALNVPSQLYSLSLGLVRKRFTLFARGLPSSKERQAMLYKDSLANGHTEQTGLHVGGVAPQPPSSAEQELSPSTSPLDSLLPSPALLESFKDTLNWETYEQVALWQLFVSEFGGQAIVATRLLRTSWVSRLTFATQAEALGGVLNMQHSLSATSPPLQLQLAVLRAAGQQHQHQQQQYQQLSHTGQEKDNQVSQDVMDLCASAVEHWGRKHPEALQAALLHLCRGELAVHAAKEEEQAMHVNNYSNNAATTTSTAKGKKGKKTGISNSAAAARALDPSSIWQDNLSSSVDEYGLLKTALVLILSWWKSIPVIPNAGLRETEETIFFEFWDSQIQSAVSNRLKEGQGPMELDHWPAAWWETRRSSSSAAATTDKKKKKNSDESRVTKSNTRRSRGISVSDSEMDEKEDDEDEERKNGSGAEEEGEEEDGDDDNDNDEDDDEDEENDDGGNGGRSNKRSAVTWASSRKTDQTKKKVPERGLAASSPRVRSSPRNQSARTMEGPKAGTSGVSQTKGRGNKGSAASSPSSSRSSTNAKSSPVATTRSSRSRNAAASSRSTRSKRRNQSEDESEGEEEEDEDEKEEGDDDEEGEGEDNDMEEDEKEPAAGSGEDEEEEEEEDDKEGHGEDEDEEGSEEEEEDAKPARGKGSTTASRNAKGRTPPQRRRLTKASSATRASNSRTTQASRRKTNKNRKGGRGKKDEESDYQQSASDDSEEDDEEGEAEEEEEEEREQESRSEDDDDDDDNTSADNRKDKSKGKSRVVNKKKNKRSQDSDAMDEDDPEEKDGEDQQSQDDDEEEEAEGNNGSEVENDKEEEDDDQGEEEEEEDDDDDEETNSRTTRTSGAAGSRSAMAQRKGSTTTSRQATRAISSSPEAQPAKRRGKHKRRISDDEDDESS